MTTPSKSAMKAAERINDAIVCGVQRVAICKVELDAVNELAEIIDSEMKRELSLDAAVTLAERVYWLVESGKMKEAALAVIAAHRGESE